MSTPPNPAIDPATIVPNEFPLRFRKHNFQSVCYNTIGCTVVYNRKYQTGHAPDRIAPPPRGPDYREAWGGVEIGIENFPPPAIVRWRSLDGEPHEATVDIGAIFADEKVLHHVPENEIPEGWAYDLRPDIYLEVNDRTIHVFMRAHIATKHPQEPGNRYSDFRSELVRAWTHTY